MPKLTTAQTGLAHLALILVFLMVFAGLGAFAISRIDGSDKPASTAVSSPSAKQDNLEQLTSDDAATAPEDLSKADFASILGTDTN